MEPEPRPDAGIATLLSDFETLGDDPEFSLLRQSLGAAPDGLFGFGTMYPNALITLLRNRFAELGATANLSARRAWGHFYIDYGRLGLSWRTEIQDNQMDEAGVIAQEAARLGRLRVDLIANLTADRRLFVYAGAASDDQIAAIRVAMSSYGRNTLLHVTLATDAEPPGSVTRREPGLLRGHLGHYGNATGRWTIATEDWIAICRAAHQVWRSG